MFRFKKECVSPRRVVVESDARYDESISMLTVLENGKFVAAIDSESKRSLSTKKADIEKNEDQKDTLMWNR